MTALPLPSASARSAAEGRDAAAIDERAGSEGVSRAREQRERVIQVSLFSVGALMMPLGIVVVFLGWYGAAHARYSYDQFPYLISGGLMGLGLTFLGGFLYFGAWLAKVGRDQKEGSRQVAEALVHIANALAQVLPVVNLQETEVALAASHLVLAGSNSTVHRRDCSLIASRGDLRPYGGDELEVSPCRVCRPAYDPPSPTTRRTARTS